jgi:hypothetical protein
MKFAAFDLEIAKEMPDGPVDLQEYAPLGITCAAVAFSDAKDPIIRQGIPCLTEMDAVSIVRELNRLTSDGYTIVTWNGCHFDFQVLAQESGLLRECGELALNHIDLMLMVTFQKGYFLKFDKALKGAGLEGKVNTVTLSNGGKMNDMDGSKAPALWASGEYEAVLTYLKADVIQLIKLTDNIQRTKLIRWTSNSGKPQSLAIPKMLPVKECFLLPEPDTSWMSNPPDRKSFTGWIPKLN